MKLLQLRKFFRIHWVLFGLLVSAVAWLALPQNVVTAQSGDHSFSYPFNALNDMVASHGWLYEQPRMLADINGDKKQDLVGFGDYGVWVATSLGNGFGYKNLAITDFGYHSGWRVENHVRTAGDINGDQTSMAPSHRRGSTARVKTQHLSRYLFRTGTLIG